MMFRDILAAGTDYQYACDFYPYLDDAPAVFWRRIDLVYPDHTAALVYARDPGEDELKALMFKLQGQSAFRVVVVDGDCRDS